MSMLMAGDILAPSYLNPLLSGTGYASVKLPEVLNLNLRNYPLA